MQSRPRTVVGNFEQCQVCRDMVSRVCRCPAAIGPSCAGPAVRHSARRSPFEHLLQLQPAALALAVPLGTPA
eukprot:8109227-Alexandrium_andersonii.AAC.1